jgi:hypothetical protein
MATEEFLLASRYKPNDPLAAEFIRTFRSQHFPGRFFLERYDALAQGAEKVDIRVLLPKQAVGKGVLDVVSLYGFRSMHPDLFYLSPWEFVQWILPQRTKPPHADYQLTVWTPAGKKKCAAKEDRNTMVAGIDYVLNDKCIEKLPNIFSFPAETSLFGGSVPTSYTTFRQTWLLQRRQRPMVPAPEHCPMPSRRKSKDMRSKIFSVYLRPWTLFRRGATPDVPFLGNLHFTSDHLQSEGAVLKIRGPGEGSIKQQYFNYSISDTHIHFWASVCRRYANLISWESKWILCFGCSSVKVCNRTPPYKDLASAEEELILGLRLCSRLLW